MTTYTISPVNHKNIGIAREWALCAHYNVVRTAHDHLAYDKGSDLDVGDKHISIKASGFTLMSGSLCEGCETLESIWAVYKAHVHSNVFAYVSLSCKVYEMNIDEFEQFVFTFGTLSRESQKNGGYVKVRARKESDKMLRWLENLAA